MCCNSDGRERAVLCNKRKQLKAIRRNADANQHSDLNQPLIPVSNYRLSYVLSPVAYLLFTSLLHLYYVNLCLSLLIKLKLTYLLS